eukprot:882393-Pelagomonas_calceolata.AAC.1
MSKKERQQVWQQTSWRECHHLLQVACHGSLQSLHAAYLDECLQHTKHRLLLLSAFKGEKSQGSCGSTAAGSSRVRAAVDQMQQKSLSHHQVLLEKHLSAPRQSA